MTNVKNPSAVKPGDFWIGIVVFYLAINFSDLLPHFAM